MIGASDKNGAYPTTDLVQGGDLTATIFRRLGIDPNGMFRAVSGMLTVPRTTARSAAVRLRFVKFEFGAAPRDENNTPA